MYLWLKLLLMKPDLLKNILIALSFMSTFSVFGQFNFDSSWQEIDAFEKKGLYREALKKVDILLEEAIKTENIVQVVKSSFFQLKYNQYITEDDYVLGIYNLEKLIEASDSKTAAILKSILAEVYFGYYARNSWKFKDRTILEADVKLEDIRTWDLERLAKKIIENYQGSIQNRHELNSVKSNAFPELIKELTNEVSNDWTLYHFLANRAFKFFSSNSFNIDGPAQTFSIKNEAYFKTNEAFINLRISTTDSFNLKYYAAETLQALTRDFLKNNDLESLFHLQLKRLRWARDYSVLANKEKLYEQAINNMALAYKDHQYVSEAWYEKAQLLFDQSQQIELKTATPEEKAKRTQAALICNQVLKKSPQTFGARQCKALLSHINSKALSISIEQAYLPNKQDKFLLSYKNCSKVFIKILSYGHEENLNSDGIKKYISKHEAIYTKEVSLPGIEDFFLHSTELLLPNLDKGHYLIAVSSDSEIEKDNIGFVYSQFWVTQLTSQVKHNGDIVEVMALCRKTGHPLEGAELKIKKSEYNRMLKKYVGKTIGTYKTDENGLVQSDELKRYQSYYVSLKSGDDFYEPKQSFYHYGNRQQNLAKTEVNLFTDRTLYRPGQTIYFKGIVTEFDGIESKLKKDYKTEVKLLDVNYQEVKKIKVITNEFGSFEGKFVAPYGVLTGRMTIKTTHGSVNVQVEEYKRPKFSAQINPLKGEYKLNDMITVKGLAEAFAGSKISDATVQYRIQRTARYNYWRWWHRPSPSKEIENGETTTNETGEFEFTFKALPDETINPKTQPIFNYFITVDVADINGETRTASKTFSLGYHSLVLANNISKQINGLEKSTFEITTSSLNGEKLGVTGNYTIHKLEAPKSTYRKRLWSNPDYQNWTKEAFNKLFPGDEFENESNYHQWKVGDILQSGSFSTKEGGKIDLNITNKWPVGKYKYMATAKDKNGIEVKDEAYFTIYNPQSKKAIDNDVCQFIPLARTVKPGQKVEFLISSAEEHLNVFYSIDFKGKTIQQDWLHLKNEQVSLDFDVTDKYVGNLHIDFTVVKNDRSYRKSFDINVPAPDHYLDISLESFRNKLLPGQDEEWTIIIKNAENEKAQAELLATLYDASLDELFSENSFNLNVTQPYFKTNSWRSPDGFGKASANNINYYWNTFEQMPYRTYPYLNTFGYNSHSYSGMIDGITLESNLFKGEGESEPMMDIDDTERRVKSNKDKKSKEASPAPVAAEHSESLDGNEEYKPGELGNDNSKSTETSSTSTLKPRQNFNETAFFYPQLHTNEAGEIQIKFTMPESLTKWRFLGLAHSKMLEIGQIEKELVTQKDLMVLPNMPRFLRENDQITISTKISNISNEVINGNATLKCFDPFTEKDITSQFVYGKEEQPFNVKSDGNTQVAWTLKVPEGRSSLKYQIIASSPKHSDGEENVLPILSNRMLVTESMPMPISKAGSKFFTFRKLKEHKSTTLKHHQLTLEFTSNPAWYALQAMPYMMEYPYECAEQTFTRYYSNAIATHVLNSKPKIKSVIDKWRNESPEAFLSNLNKNQELKSLILEETPWVLNANNESETKQNLSVLLDLNRMNGELQKALSKTIKAQSNSGGWSWFPGMRDNRYITQHIITGLGHLDVLGISAIKTDRKVRRMVVKGVQYLDNQIVLDLERLKKYHSESYLGKNHLGYIQIQYLYMRSYFKDIKMSKATQEAVIYYKSQAEKFWLEYNIYAKGMIGLAAKRMEMDELSTDIYKSLKDNAILHEEFGMYWKSYTSGYYWYQAPIETQALMIEFFNEMNDMSSVEQLKMWLLKEKQTTHWKTTKQTTEAVYALLLNGIDLLATNNLVKVTVGGKAIEYNNEPSSDPYIVKPEPGTGYFKTKWNTKDIHSEMSSIKVIKDSPGPAWGAMYWQYFEDLDKITFAKTPLQLDKTIHKVVLTNRGEKLETISSQSSLNVGDKVRVRIELRTDRNLEYVHMKDLRASGFEPINVVSKYKYQGGLGYYQATKDASTNFFFDFIPKGTYVFEYDLRAEQVGNFSNGIASIQCMYAPEYMSHSNGVRIEIMTKQ